MDRPINSSRNNGRRSVVPFILSIFLSTSCLHDNASLYASASAVAPPVMAARLGTKTRRTRKSSPSSDVSPAKHAAVIMETSATAVAEPPTAETATSDGDDTSTPEATSSSNPLVQLVTYVKTSVVNFKDGLGQMNTDHKRCNAIRAKQIIYAKANGTMRRRGIKGLQTGGISYEEYDFLKKGLVDRNKLFAVGCVSVCLPNYFVYYLWSFPDMMPSPFMKATDLMENEVSRQRCHAVISTMLNIEKGARVAPWTAKLNPFGRKATEKAMDRLTSFVALGCANMEEYGATGSNGMKMMVKKLKPTLYQSVPLTKRQSLLAAKTIPKQIMKGLTKAIAADPLNKGSSPFGIGAVKHIDSVRLADEFLIDQQVDVDSITSNLLAEACSARLIGGPGTTDEERKEALNTWLQEMEITPREITKDGSVYFNANLARAALMCYNAVDGTRDARADSSLLRVMYQGQKSKPLI